MQLGYTLHMLFATIVFLCNPTSPGVLWNRFKHNICDDLLYKLTAIYPNCDFAQDEIYDYGLHLIDDVLRKWGTQLSDVPGMPQIIGNWGVIAEGNRLINEQLNYNIGELTERVAANMAQFNNAQREVYDAVMNSVTNNNGKIFFLHSAGGCGKTFVCNTIAAAVHAQGKIVLYVASSGNEASFCRISQHSHVFPLLHETSMIIWDEVPMQHKYAVEAVDRTIRDLLQKPHSPFGGITVLFGGDFRQTLPVIPHGLRQQFISASLRRSILWEHVEMHYLHQNMHLEQTPDMQEFVHWLLEVGAGTNLDNNVSTIPIPPNMICPNNSVDSLIEEIYPGIQHGEKDDQYFLDRSILACKNDIVTRLNSELLEVFPGEKEVLLSADSVQFDDPGMNELQPYAPEYLNSLVSSSLPLTHLGLKVGCPVMLLRNLDPLKGLCNGTRLRVSEIRRKVLKCRIISGDAKFAGNVVFIPKITLAPSAEDLPIPLRRRQFPVRLAFAMTVNKSQGQSLKHVGLDLRSPVFSHGQLYVGLSRCTSGSRLKVLLKEADEGRTPNIVYKEILTGLQL